MPLAVTLCLDPAASAGVERMWGTLAAAGIDADRAGLGYAPHVTLAIYPDGVPPGDLGREAARFAATWTALDVTLGALGVFPGPSSILWAAPVVTEGLLGRHRSWHEATLQWPVHPHYRAGAWMPHVTLSGPLADPGPAVAVLAPAWRTVTGTLDRLEVVRFRPVEVLRSHPCRGAGQTVPPPA